MSNLATITNNILADSGIDDLNVVVTTGSYSNPAWITALAWTKITGTPTTLAGYGITDALFKSTSQLANTNLDNMTTSGLYYSADQYSTNTNIPYANFFVLFNLMNEADRQAQLFFTDTPSSAGGLWWRPKQGSTGWHSWEKIITTVNYNSYSPTLTGTGASGTWGINITGSSATTSAVSGTTNYVSKFTSSSAIGNSQIYDNGTSVVIGYTSSSYKFEVYSAKSLFYNVSIGGTATGTYAAYSDSVIGIGNLHLGTTAGAVYINTELALPTYINPAGGNVGIGTLSVSGTYEKLAVAGGISIKDNSSGKLEIGRYNNSTAPNSYIKLGANSNSLRFTNNTDAADIMELTNSGSLGLGVTPNLWGSGYTAFQIGASGSISYTGAGANDFSFATNAYYDSSDSRWEYRYTGDGAARYSMTALGAQHIWYNSVTGTANAAISWIQAMTLKTTSQLQLNKYGIGTFTGTVAYNLAVDSSGNIIETAGGVVDGSGTANYVPRWSDPNTLTNSIIYDSGSAISIGTTSAGGFKLYVNDTFKAEATFSTYVNDGLYSANARPSAIGLPNGTNILFGYYSAGDGNYYGRIGTNGPNSSKVSFGAFQENIFTVNTGTGNTERFRVDNSASSVTGRFIVNGPTTSTSPVVDITATGTGTFMRGVRMLNSGMASGDHLMYAVGQADNTKNMGQFYFYYVGSGSNSNRISMGLHGVDDKFNIFGTGNISINTTNDLAVALGVSGSIKAVAGYVASTDGTINNEISHSGVSGLLGTTTNHQLLIRTNATTAITVNTNQTVAFASSLSTVGGSSSAQFTFGVGGIGMSRNQSNNGIWFNGGTDTNHVLWNDYYGGPTGQTATPTGFDGMKWYTYRGIYIYGGSLSAGTLVTALEISNSSSNVGDHTVSLYASGVKRLQTTTSGVTVTGGLLTSGTGSFTSGVYVQASNNSDLPFINFSNNGGAFNWGRVGGLLQGDGDGSLYFQTKLGASLITRFIITSTGASTLSGRLTVSDGIKINSVESTLYESNGALAYYSASNAVYLNGAGPNGWLRLNAAGSENDRNSINIFGSGAGSPDRINFRTGDGTRLTITNNQASFNGNVSAGTTINWNSGIGALSYGTGFVTMETNTANAIQFKTNGQLAQTINTNQTILFSNNIGLNNTNGLLFNGLADNNWKIYRTNGTPDFARAIITGPSLNINAHYNSEGFAIGANGGNSYYEILGNSTGTSATHYFRGTASVTGALSSASLSTGTINGGNTNVGILGFTCGFSSYTTDGLFSANAVYSSLGTPCCSNRLRFGYNDYGGGQYYGAIGFDGPTQFSIGHRYTSAGTVFGFGTGYRGNGVLVDASNTIFIPEKLSIGGWGSNVAGLNLRGYGVIDSTANYGFILDRGTKIAWTDGGNASTGEYIYSQQAGPYSVTIHSGGYNALACPNTGHVYINYEAGTCSIGSTSFSTTYKLYVTGSTYSSGGFFESSDIRLKTIVNEHESVNFKAIEFNWNDGRDAKLHWGYAAQDVLLWLPDAVNEHEDGYLSLDYNQVHTYKIAMLEKRIAELEQQLKNK
jgi:hypothetical protein